MAATFAVAAGLLVGALTFGASNSLLWGLAAGAAIGGSYYAISTHRYRRRKRLLSTPFPGSWRKVLERRVEFYCNLDGDGRRRFEDDVRIFLAEQNVYGLRGAAVSDEARVLIAAAAATLGHGIPDWEWPSLRDVVVYPRAFDDECRQSGDAEILGMVHAQGPILISERDLKHGFCRPHDGHNVAMHELAHVMDFATGHADGLPAGLEWVATAPWVDVVAQRLRKLRKKHRSVLRRYAATNEAEFFAVAVEAFFERPRRLHREDPELYAMLADYFRQDPAGTRTARTNAPPAERAGRAPAELG